MATETLSKPAEKRLFRLGLRGDCPFQVIHLAGVEFPKVTEKVSGFGPETKRSEVRGVTLELTKEKLEAIKKAATFKVIRSTHGKKARSFMLDTRGTGKVIDGQPTRPYVAQPGDQSVEEFIYISAVEHSAYEEPSIPTLGETKRVEAAEKAAEALESAGKGREKPSRK